MDGQVCVVFWDSLLKDWLRACFSNTLHGFLSTEFPLLNLFLLRIVRVAYVTCNETLTDTPTMQLSVETVCKIM